MNRPILYRVQLALSIVLITALAGCMHVPARVKHPLLRTEVPLDGLHVPTTGNWPDSQWWHLYHDRQLDRLMAQALAHAPSLNEARSRVEAARQSVRLTAARAGLSINGNIQISRQRVSDNGLMPPQLIGFSWYNQADLGLQLKYSFDWWGKKRSAIEASLDQAHAAAAQRSAAALILENAIANTYFDYLADQARLTLASKAVEIQQQYLHIAQLRVRQGVDEADTVQQAILLLANVRQQQAMLRASSRIHKVSLAALIGISTAKLPKLALRPLPTITGALPANARLDLIARRPDIIASRWQVEAALKETNRARAQFFPDISISALIGLSSIDQVNTQMPGRVVSGGTLWNVFKSGSRVLGMSPAIHLPIFEGGQLKAAFGVSRARLEASVAQYNAVLNSAAREVASKALEAQQIAVRRTQQARQLRATQTLLKQAHARVQQGVLDARAVLRATAQCLQQEDASVSLHAQALSTDLALIKALGGGYHAPTSTPTLDTSMTVTSGNHQP